MRLLRDEWDDLRAYALRRDLSVGGAARELVCVGLGLGVPTPLSSVGGRGARARRDVGLIVYTPTRMLAPERLALEAWASSRNLSVGGAARELVCVGLGRRAPEPLRSGRAPGSRARHQHQEALPM